MNYTHVCGEVKAIVIYREQLVLAILARSARNVQCLQNTLRQIDTCPLPSEGRYTCSIWIHCSLCTYVIHIYLYIIAFDIIQKCAELFQIEF